MVMVRNIEWLEITPCFEYTSEYGTVTKLILGIWNFISEDSRIESFHIRGVSWNIKFPHKVIDKEIRKQLKNKTTSTSSRG